MERKPFHLGEKLSISKYLVSKTIKAGRTVQDCVLDPQATSRFSGFLERLEELRKVIILTVSVYYSRRVQSKISKGPQCTGQSPGKTRYKLLLHSCPGCLLPVESPGGTQSSQQVCGTRCEILPIRKAHSRLDVHGLCREWVTEAWSISDPTLVALSAALEEVKLLQKAQGSRHKSHG